MAAAIAAMLAAGAGTKMKIEEGIADYNTAIADINARSAQEGWEALRQRNVSQAEETRAIGAAKKEGVLGLKERGAQAAFEGRMAMTSAEMTASSEEARLGASGVRGRGSPLLAAQQNVDLAFAAADRTIESGNAGMKLGGLQLKNTMAGIGAAGAMQRGNIEGQSSLATFEYARQTREATRKRNELASNKNKMIAIALAGGGSGLASSFYRSGDALGWF
jgi:hypothetical protein